MDELKAILRYWRMVFWETLCEIGVFSAIVATGAGMTAVLLAAHFGFAQKGEIPELIFITGVSAVAGVLLEFVIKLFFITPPKIHKKYESYVGELEEELNNNATLNQVNPFEVEPICKPNSRSPLTCASCQIHVKNPNRGGYFVDVKLTTIIPPMKGPPIRQNSDIKWPYGVTIYSSDEGDIDAATFDFNNCRDGEINDGETGKIEVFTAVRGDAGTTVAFSGNWKKAGNSQFIGEGEHIMTISVSASGMPSIQTKQHSFKITFSKDMSLPVFSIEK